MIKINKNILAVMLLQTVLAVVGGFGLMLFTASGNASPNVHVGSVSIGGLSREQAFQKIMGHYDKVLKEGSLIIKYSDSAEYKIKYSQIDAALNYQATLDRLYSRSIGETLSNIITDHFTRKRRTVFPIIDFNESKLQEELTGFSHLVDKEAVNANIYLKGSSVIKVAEANGIKLNLDNVLTKLKKGIGEYLENPYTLRTGEGSDLEVSLPVYTLKDYDGAEEVIAKYSTEIKYLDNLDQIKLAIAAINKVVIYPAEDKKGSEAGVFSFNKYLSMNNGIIERNNEGYNQVVSTLYAAVLVAGIRHEDITRTSHRTPVDYIEPGLDAVVFGNSVDFKFKNTLKSPLVVFAEVKDAKINISLVSSKRDSTIKTSLKVEVDTRHDPKIIQNVSHDLQPGQKMVINPGSEGLKVKVFRVTMKDGAEVSKDLIYYDEYKAVETMVHIGTDTKKENKTVK